VNGNILKLQMEMQRLLQTRMFSMNQAVVSPEQKENLFSTVAELFDQSCSSLELSLNEVRTKVGRKYSVTVVYRLRTRCHCVSHGVATCPR